MTLDNFFAYFKQTRAENKQLKEELRGEKLLSEKRRTDGIEMMLEIKQLKMAINQDNITLKFVSSQNEKNKEIVQRVREILHVFETEAELEGGNNPYVNSNVSRLKEILGDKA